jgi:tetratricopeptide (TPR) repeat protein
MIYQRFGNHDKALLYFDSALKYEHINYSIPQEASLSAMHLKQFDRALEYCVEAIKRKPDNFVLWGNYSLNLLIAGFDDEAKKAIEKALSIDSTDKINQKIKAKIIEVIAGQTKRPKFNETIG